MDFKPQGGFPYHIFRFNISEISITSISIEWIGHGEQWSLGHIYSAKICILNATNQKWETLGNYTNNSSQDKVIFKEYDAFANNYVDTHGHLFILAYAEFGGGYSNSTLFTNYIEMTTIHSESPEFSFIFFPFVIAFMLFVVIRNFNK
jgi:hypothetical protein